MGTLAVEYFQDILVDSPSTCCTGVRIVSNPQSHLNSVVRGRVCYQPNAQQVSRDGEGDLLELCQRKNARQNFSNIATKNNTTTAVRLKH